MTKTAKEIVAEEAARKKALTEKLKAERLAAIEARPVRYKMSIDIFSEEDMIALKQILVDLGFKPHTRSQEITRKPMSQTRHGKEVLEFLKQGPAHIKSIIDHCYSRGFKETSTRSVVSAIHREGKHLLAQGEGYYALNRVKPVYSILGTGILRDPTGKIVDQFPSRAAAEEWCIKNNCDYKVL